MEKMAGLEELSNFYRGKRVFITGHSGFKGRWLSRMLVMLGASITGYSLPLSTVADEAAYAKLHLSEDIHYEFGDIRDYEHLRRAFLAAEPEIVLHLAAQPIVLTGYREPAYTYAVNVMGTVNLFECVRASDTVRSVVNVTTDKVYENKEWLWGYRENEPLLGHDPYSSSKSCSEMVTYSYRSSFLAEKGVAVSTARAGNVIGGGDYAPNRIIPDAIRAAQSKQKLILRNPDSIRPYQHVLEPIYAYLLLAMRQWERQELADCYNVGPDESDCITTDGLAALFCRCWGDGMSYEAVRMEWPHEAGFLKLDCSRLKTGLSWQPRWHIGEAVARTVEWAKADMRGEDMAGVTDKQIKEYLYV